MRPRYPEFNRNSYEIPDNDTLLYQYHHNLNNTSLVQRANRQIENVSISFKF